MEWKSIKDHEPEDEQMCVVTHEDVSGRIYFADYCKITKLFFYVERAKVRCFPIEVTHWMPIPESPWSKKHPPNPQVNNVVYKRADIEVG